MGGSKVARIQTVNRKEPLRRRPRPHQGLVIQQPEVVPEPHYGDATAAAFQTRGRVPGEGRLGGRGDLVGRQSGDRRGAGRRRRRGGAHGGAEIAEGRDRGGVGGERSDLGGEEGLRAGRGAADGKSHGSSSSNVEGLREPKETGGRRGRRRRRATSDDLGALYVAKYETMGESRIVESGSDTRRDAQRILQGHL